MEQELSKIIGNINQEKTEKIKDSYSQRITQANEDGDTVSATNLSMEYMDKMNEIKQQQPVNNYQNVQPQYNQQQNNQQTPQAPPEVIAFLARNPWMSDPVMEAAAFATDKQVGNENRYFTEGERLAETERRMKAKFPHLSGQSAVNSATQGSTNRVANTKRSPVKRSDINALRSLGGFDKMTDNEVAKFYLETNKK